MKNIEEFTNKIFNADSYEFIKQIPDKSVDCVYIDIPYLFTQGGEGHSELGKRAMKKKQSLIDLNIESGCDYTIFNEVIRVLKSINCFIWCSKLQLNDIMNIFLPLGVNFELLVWCKTNPQPTVNNTWLPDIEYCLYFREKGVKFNDGYELKSKYFIQKLNVYDKGLYDHPTIKPISLVKRHLQHTTQENDIILDCFLGSGTTAVACKELNRQYIGIEIDKQYFKIAEDRLNGITASGQTGMF